MNIPIQFPDGVYVEHLVPAAIDIAEANREIDLEEAVDCFCKRLFTSPLFYTVLIAAIFITTSIIAIVFLSPIPLVLAIISALALCILFDYKAIHLWGEIKFLRNVLIHWRNPVQNPWHHPIIDDKLYLGAIPLATHNHAEQLLQHQIHTVIAVCERWERDHQSWLSIPHSPQHLQRLGLEYLYVETPDYLAPGIESLDRLADFLYERLRNNLKVYVHCKSGKGRSATVLAALLIKYPELIQREHTTVQEVTTYLHDRRPDATFNREQTRLLDAFYIKCHPELAPQPEAQED